MRRVLVAAIASLVIAGLIAPAVAAAPATDRGAAVPRVVVIVGPSGAATDRYRAEGRAAAAVARKYTPDVTELYSPNATWPAVKKALQGASLVIYMGHGNGWPSKYRDSLFPSTQNGFGLNPTAGGGDSSHQYFGESKIADSIRLAKNAVVLLNHLCYASGNTEPGLAEGTLDQARQRVDNFAAGFIASGASAVVAEAYASPNHMIRAVLGGNRSIESAWRTAPSANRHAFAFESSRSPGYIAQMDPERTESGYSRSIVLKAGLASADVRRGARGQAPGASGPVASAPVIPSLAGAGVTLAMPTTNGATTAGGRIHYKIPFTIADRKDLPDGVQASVRWDPIDVVAPDPGAEVPADPAAAETPETPAAPAAPDFGLVTAERVGDVVAPSALKITKTRMAFDVAAPAAPGRYRLTVMLHDAEGVAYDAATQAMVPALLVRVTGDVDAGIDAPTRLDLAPGGASKLSLWVANLGKAPWGHQAIRGDSKDPGNSEPATAAHLTGTWVALGASDDPARQAAADAASVTALRLPAGFKVGATAAADLALFAPSLAGDYLLVLDIVTPEAGSLTARGVEPTIIRVTVAPQPAPTPAPPVNGE